MVLAHDITGTGPAVLLLHTDVSDQRMVDPQLPTLVGAGYRVVRCELPAGAATDAAQAVLDLLDALGLDRVALVGSSSGGRVAQEVAAHRPDRVSALALLRTETETGAVPDGLAASTVPVRLVSGGGDLLDFLRSVRAPAPTAEQPVTRAVVLDAHFHAARPAARVEVREIRMLAGHAAGLHVHNGPVVGSIVEGSAIYQIDGQPEVVLRAGDVFYEPEGARIARFDATDEGVRFLGYFVLGPDQVPEIDVPGQ